MAEGQGQTPQTEGTTLSEAWCTQKLIPSTVQGSTALG